VLGHESGSRLAERLEPLQRGDDDLLQSQLGQQKIRRQQQLDSQKNGLLPSCKSNSYR
jgi:hypothetical protein